MKFFEKMRSFLFHPFPSLARFAIRNYDCLLVLAVAVDGLERKQVHKK
ncbi:MAG: hypothetical protein ACD_8C00059G0005 [uncultured bacterium]|nr:MAG: hypothetical protein ACD_8C00059G0005 [uncultured bacterium]